MAFVRKANKSEVLNVVLEANDALAADNEIEIDRRVKAELERLRQAAYGDGYTAGERAAKLEGQAYKQRLADIEEALGRAVDEIAAPLKNFEEGFEDIVLQSAFKIVEICGLSGVSVAENGRRVLKRIFAEISEFSFAKTVEVRLNPEDLAILAAEGGGHKVDYIGDEGVVKGGVSVEIFGLSGDQFQNVGWDGTIQAKLSLIRDGLDIFGKEDGS
ncbi:FliH/SctL family protein [Acidocella sp.]|uniref:FliH/SctL family protein n=1 Tax=Acidocella sp. TaxID=50710 RepID=UPI002601C50A|nr:FliH/SctL family protein [Acidocella sp.]